MMDIYRTEKGGKLYAPVCPPSAVVTQVVSTGAPVYWCNGPMVYLTEVRHGVDFTYLCKKSPKPKDGWLRTEPIADVLCEDYRHDLKTAGIHVGK